MAIEGKKRYVVYLDESEVETLKEYLDTRPGQGGLSELLQAHVTRCAKMVRKHGDSLKQITPGKITAKKFFQLLKVMS